MSGAVQDSRALAVAGPARPRRESRLGRAWRRVRKDRGGLAGAAIVLIMAAVAAVPGALAPYDPDALFSGPRLAPPSAAHWFGTDELGRDLFSRVVHGTRISLAAALVVVAASCTVGTALGVAAGFRGGRLDDAVMRLADLFISFPDLIIAMAVVAFLGPGLSNAMLAVAIVWWPQYARLARGQVLVERSKLYVEAALAVGVPPSRILARHVLPNVMLPIVVKATLDVGMGVLMTASLTFLGLGPPPPSPELGSLVTQGRAYITDAWWYPTFPGLFIFLAGLGFNLLGDALRTMVDPAAR